MTTPPLVRTPGPEPLAASVTEASLRLLGVPVTVLYQPVEDELQRRADCSLEPLLGYGDLMALAQLPVDIPVPRSALDHTTVARLSRIPFGAVDVGEQLTRRAVAAVRVRAVVHEGSQWSRALERASRFAPYAQRTVALPRMPRNLARVRTEAAYYGVGVRVGCGDDCVWIAHPAPFRPQRYSAASWMLDETVLAATSGRG